MSEWSDQYPVMDRDVQVAVAEWVMYYEDCERYDRMVCTGPMGRDGILPANSRELGQIGKNAMYRSVDMKKRHEFPKKVWDEAKKIVLNTRVKPWLRR